ncbi:MAG: sigma-70 family RNA polymerase sigma factor [Actinomycetota bacterium]
MATRRIGHTDRVVATDAELVMRVRNGDQAALAAIYDRYVARLVDLARAIVGPSGAEDVVQDAFVGAAGRIDQLREPDKLKPWLYRITRRYALAHLRGRRVEPMGLEVTVGDATVDGPLTEAERDELRRLVDDAAAGLEERDRVMLHLLYRHELSPEEAGEVLDMRAEQVHARSFRVRDRFARSLGAVVVARHGRGNCGELRELLSGWDGTITPRWRKKISRHLDRCETCSSTKDRVAAPMALLSVAPLVPVAASMRQQTLDAMSEALGFGSFDGGDLAGDGDSSSEQSQGQQGPQHGPANHPASSGTTSSASGTAGAGSAAPSASASGSTAGFSSSSTGSAAASSAGAGASGASSSSSVSAGSLTPTGPTTGWPSGTLAGAGASSSSSSAAASATAKVGSGASSGVTAGAGAGSGATSGATAGAAVPPTPEIVSSPPPPPELNEPGIASTLIDTVKAAVGVGGAIAATTTSTTLPPETAIEDPPGIEVVIDGDTIALSPAETIEVTVPIGPPATTVAPTTTTPTTIPETTVVTTTTTIPETTTTVPETSTTTTTVPETTVPSTTVPDETTTTTTVPETTTTVPATTTTVDPLGGPTGADDDGGTEGGSDDGTGGAEDDTTGGADDGSTGGADEATETTQP